MELMNQPYLDVVSMPYKFFLDTVKWKMDLEEEKRKRIEEKTKIAAKGMNASQKNMRQQKAKR